MGLSTTIPSIAIKKLIPILESQVMQLIDITSYIEIAINSLPFNIKCNDPMINDIKQQLENVRKLNQNIIKIKTSLNTLSKAFNIVFGVAKGVELIQLAIPAVPGVPQGPFAKLASIASALGNNCKSAAKCLSSILSAFDLASSKLDSILAIAITKLTTICTNEIFPVTKNVQTEIIKLTEQSNFNVSSNTAATINNKLDSSKGFYSGYTSNFYNEYNVSKEDLDTLENIIYDLNELQLTITDYLLEAPTATYSGETIPSPDLGKIGDFYINFVKQEIYGPKLDDGAWGDAPIKY